MEGEGIKRRLNFQEIQGVEYPSLIPFRHGELGRQSRSSKKIPRKVIINTLNYLNFTEGQAIMLMAHRLKGEEFLLYALPGPCLEDIVSLSVMMDTPFDLENFELKSLIMDIGQSVMIISVELIECSDITFTVRLGTDGIISSKRQARRFQCSFVEAVIRQGSLQVSGMLVDFNSSGLRIEISEKLVSMKSSFALNKELSITLHRQGRLVFSGDCKYIRDEEGDDSIIFEPTQTHQALFKTRKLRNPRICLVPTPKITFIHPFSNKRVTFEVSDITNSGFSVLEGHDVGQLIPGMIVPEITIFYSGGLKLKCSAQVVYEQNQRKVQKYGFAIYDMDLVTYNRFFDIYSCAIDKHANVTSEVDMDALWEFFFKSGFIYPKKYETLNLYKEDFKQTYEKLYLNNTEIFASFTYQSNGNIFGHVSWIKAYDRTWMIHHLAAKPMGRKRVGLYVLNNVMYCFDGFSRLPSTGMDYMIFYFRPENKFPDYFFGGFCRAYKNPKGCSMDCLAYLNCSLLPQYSTLPEGWEIHECSREDITSLRSWYELQSGGLMIDAFGLDAEKEGQGNISSLYEKYGLMRKYQAHVLKFKGIAKAFIVADESDMGVNLSEFLNSLKIIVTSNDLPWEILQSSLGKFDKYEKKMIPLLVYPYSYLDEQGINYNSKYNLWVLSAKSSDAYTDHLKDLAKIRLGKLLMHYLSTKFRKK
jgi:hypothetical protein